LLSEPGRDWYVNFTPEIPLEEDHSPNVYVDAAAPVGCAPGLGGLDRILRREKRPVLGLILARDPSRFVAAARRVVQRLSPGRLAALVDDLPIAVCGQARRQELIRILGSRRQHLVEACRWYAARFEKGRTDAPGFSAPVRAGAAAATPRDPAMLPPDETERKYWACHGRTGQPIVDTYYRVGEGRSFRLRQTTGGLFFTAKGPASIEGSTKRRRELEFPADPKVLEALEIAGLPVLARLSKTRAEEHRGGCTVAFDRIERLGEFIELEGPPEQLEAVARELGLQPSALEPRSYLELMLED
jgi:adenylate cyclase class IV